MVALLLKLLWQNLPIGYVSSWTLTGSGVVAFVRAGLKEKE